MLVKKYGIVMNNSTIKRSLSFEQNNNS